MCLMRLGSQERGVWWSAERIHLPCEPWKGTSSDFCHLVLLCPWAVLKILWFGENQAIPVSVQSCAVCQGARWGLAVLGRDGGSWKTQPDFSVYIIWVLYTQITSIKSWPSPSPVSWFYSHSLCASADWVTFYYHSHPSRTDIVISNWTSVLKFYCAASLNVLFLRATSQLKGHS